MKYTPWTLGQYGNIYDSLGEDIATVLNSKHGKILVAAPKLLDACLEALIAFQLLGSGQQPPHSNAEYCEYIGRAIDIATK